jgi:outer membrane protein OmpA-like peptidoglycan-associated protein
LYYKIVHVLYVRSGNSFSREIFPYFFTFKISFMSFNLIEMVKNFFTGEFTSQASAALGENSSDISKALSAIIPTGLAAILNKATSGTEGANEVLNMAKSAVGSVTGNVNLTSDATMEKGSSMLSGLFGNNQSGIIGTLSRFAGIKDSSASSLLSMGLPAIMGLLGRHAEQNNLSASGLAGFLSSQKDHILNALPSGLSSMAGMLGLGSLGSAAASMASRAKSTGGDSIQGAADKASGTAQWLLPLIIILAAIALLWYFSKSCNQTKPSTAAQTDTSALVQSADTATSMRPAMTTPEPVQVKLPNGKELDAFKGGIEDQLVTFLSGNWKSLSDDSLKARWFNFDHLNFNTANATLLPESEKQLDNIAEILKAFPEAKIKIGGYTDAAGNQAANKKLSQARADAARSGLVKRGVGSQVTGAEGYGSQFARAAATAPDEERALDRHVSVGVRK